jgi:hypothetical protein
MIRPAASQQRRLKTGPAPKAQGPRTQPQNPPAQTAVPPPGQLRLVRIGTGSAAQVWRLKMQTTDEAARLPGLAGALRVWGAARAALALIGLGTVLACAHPVAREALLRQAAGLAQYWDGQPDNSSAGMIQAGLRGAAEGEQRAVVEFIGKRYRVSQDAIAGFVSAAYRAGGDWRVDPLLILAVMAIESRYNPVAESNMGAKGLMQVIPKFHLEKLLEHGGEAALLDPQVNIQVGAQILREYLRRFGETETALQMYAGAFDEPSSSYAVKVLAERARLEAAVGRQKRSI